MITQLIVMNIFSMFLVFLSVRILHIFIFNNLSLSCVARLIDGPEAKAIIQMFWVEVSEDGVCRLKLGCIHGSNVVTFLLEIF